MTSSNPPARPALAEAISSLRDASILHSDAWARHQNPVIRPQAQRDGGRAASLAIRSLPIIYDIYLGARDSARASNAYTGSGLEAFFQIRCGRAVAPATLAEQSANQPTLAGILGQARLPHRAVAPLSPQMDQALNYIKHRHRPDELWLNFRDDNGRHMLAMCGPAQGSRPAFIFEFDVLEFCDLCDTGIGLV